MLKKQWLAAVLIGSLCTFASAQQQDNQPATQPARPFAGNGNGAGNGGGRAEAFGQRVRDALNELNLTDDQNKKIDAILDQARSDFQNLAPQLRTMQPQERQQKMRDLIDGMRDKLKAVLTPEQQQQFVKKMQEMRPQRGNGQLGQNSTNSPTALPSNTQAQPGQKMDAMIQRLQESLAALNLNGDQKAQANKIIQDTKAQLNDLRNKARNGGINPDDARSQTQDILSSTRDQLAGILSKDQQEQLRDEIQKRVNESSPATRPTASADMKDEAMKDQTMQGDTMQGDAMKDGANGSSGNSKNSNVSKSAFLSSAGPKIGEPAPALNATSIMGRPVQLAAFKGKLLVIEFGSYSSPSFRDHMAKMEELARQNDLRASFLIVYTKEAHPQGGWDVDRNREDRISVPQSTDMKSRTADAQEAREALKITIPIAIDSMDNATAATYGAGENSAVVIGRDGTVVAKEDWCDPFRLKAAIDEAAQQKTVASAQ